MGVQVLSYDLMKTLDSQTRVKKVLEIVKKGDIVMVEGRLNSEEELMLTSKALESVSGKFSGVEIAHLSSTSTQSLVDKIKSKLIKVLANDRFGISVIGPSKIIKDIKMDPQKLEILFK